MKKSNLIYIIDLISSEIYGKILAIAVCAPCVSMPIWGNDRSHFRSGKDNAFMQKKILRIVSLLLLLVTLVGVAPTMQISAATSEEKRIISLVESTYRKALKRTGRRSFHGWCGAAVDWQMRLLGITTNVVGSDGNDKYDQYRKQEYSSGGYKIKAYSAKKYDLEEALNAISNNGTKNAYNIMVGFQWTNTSAGRKYGHAVFIYAIIDGNVYFNESFGTTFNGKYYSEGKCMVGTIEQFVKYYKSWCRLDGVIHFGVKTYADECVPYQAYLYANTTAETTLYSEPCTPDVDDRCKVQRQLAPGERLSVTGLYVNTLGEYWYRVEDADIGYVRAEDTQVQNLRYDDVTIKSVKAPSVLREGSSFSIKGVITGEYVSVISVRAQIFRVDQEGLTHMMTTNASVLDNEYSLYKSTVGKRLKFKSLELGNYHYELAAVVSNHYYADGELQTAWQTVKLWTSDFQVVEKTGETASVTFDACGGTAELNATELSLGQPLGQLPMAQREGYLFTGWYTADGELVDSEYVLEGKMTLYAQWAEAGVGTGWYEQDGRPYYIMDGVRLEGFFQVDGVTYHQNAEGFLDIGWTEIEGEYCYFNTNGSMATGWLVMPEGTYYMGVDGTMVIGWAFIDEQSYYFNEKGHMVTGKHTLNGAEYDFGKDGALIPKEFTPNNKIPVVAVSPCDI